MARVFRCNAHARKEDTAEDAVRKATHTTPSTVLGGQERKLHDFRRCTDVSHITRNQSE